MGKDKYTWRVTSHSEDGPATLCERNGVTFWDDLSPGKLFTRERALALAAEHTQVMTGPDDEQTVWIRTERKKPRTLRARLASQASRAAYKADCDAEMAKLDELYRTWE